MSGLVDGFWLFEHWVLPAVAVGVAAAVTVWAVLCTRIGDRLLGTGLGVLGGFVGGVWFALYAKRHSRPLAQDDGPSAEQAIPADDLPHV